jgi:hypothetical protein
MSRSQRSPVRRSGTALRRSIWPPLLADLRVTARSRFGAGNFPEVTEILASAKPTRGGIQAAIDRIRNLKAPDDVGDEPAREYAASIASCADDFQQQLTRAIADLSSARSGAVVPSGRQQTLGAADDLPLVIRPRVAVWAGIVLLLVIAALPGTAGVAALISGHLVAGLILLGLGVVVGVPPVAYFLRARVTLQDGVLTKVGLVRKVGWSSLDAVASIQRYRTRWYWSDNGPWETEGYAFRLANGIPIFKLSTNWWSPEDIATLARRVGIAIADGSSPGRRRRPAPRPPAPALGCSRRCMRSRPTVVRLPQNNSGSHCAAPTRAWLWLTRRPQEIVTRNVLFSWAPSFTPVYSSLESRWWLPGCPLGKSL